MRLRLHTPLRGGFTLVEAVIAISLAAMAGAVLLAGVNASVKVTDDALRETIALGMAEQLMDEIVARPHNRTTTSSSLPRAQFDDVLDYAGYTAGPPVDPWKIQLGKDDVQGALRHANFMDPSGLIDNWQERVTVQAVKEDGTSQVLTAGQDPDFVSIDVRIVYTDPSGTIRELARLRRVVAYVD
jgi:type II secretory pathway pseudopilin PulG